jgi:hypothetical protein
MHQIPAKQAAAETVALEGTQELDAGSAGRYSPRLNNEGERTMKLLGRFLLVVALLGQFVVSALCQQAQSSGTTGSTSNAATLPAAPIINPINSSPSTTTLSPTGARRGVSISTVTVCDFDDFSGSYTNVDDVCSVGAGRLIEALETLIRLPRTPLRP